VSMTHHQALEVLAAQRGRHVVITTHGSIDLWVSLSDTPLDFAYVPTTMGQGPALGLGLALAQSRHGVIVVSGEGSLLMNLGCLVTLANHPANVYFTIIDNGVYEVTGGQPVAGSGQTDFAGMARAAGIQRVYHCDTSEQWRATAAEALSGPGPVVIWLQVAVRPGQRAPTTARPMEQQIGWLRQVLGITNSAEAVDRISAVNAGSIK
jgi:sulfopyruvate decarboxylase subunit beta